jgi:hypothetical protein
MNPDAPQESFTKSQLELIEYEGFLLQKKKPFQIVFPLKSALSYIYGFNIA